MADATGFRIRLRVRIPKSFTTESTSLHVAVANKDVTITGQERDEPLNKAKWIVLIACGFSTEQAATSFGNRLRSIVQLAALSSRLGADVGEDKPSGWVNEDFARSIGLIKEHERIAANIHGLAILPDDDNTRIPIIKIEGTVTADPEQFASALKEIGDSDHSNLGGAANGVRLINLALMASEPLAQMVLALSAVEELGQCEEWSDCQKSLIEYLASVAETSEGGTADERAEITQAIRNGLFRLSLRQGVMRLLSRLGLGQQRKEWDRLYGIRSGLFHGIAHLSNEEINAAAQDTLTLCGAIILTAVASENIQIPSVAAKHFSVGIRHPNRDAPVR
jgi:hypothetical protein